MGRKEGRKDLFYTCTSLVAAVRTNPAVAVTIVVVNRGASERFFRTTGSH